MTGHLRGGEQRNFSVYGTINSFDYQPVRASAKEGSVSRTTSYAYNPKNLYTRSHRKYAICAFGGLGAIEGRYGLRYISLHFHVWEQPIQSRPQ